ncbi:hypothetical protein OBBRIDRAFT_787579 [Obba rivulosa]|uniref:Glycosyltransferase family 31 protein n=1 Tax=Obba rivulosa TaxID=1052685 RepID=A0A8E2DUK4_9APHY|nr:hypothetical protein OBBRIDRAFT_787579 [Obba rivulosa]
MSLFSNWLSPAARPKIRLSTLSPQPGHYHDHEPDDGDDSASELDLDPESSLHPRTPFPASSSSSANLTLHPNTSVPDRSLLCPQPVHAEGSYAPSPSSSVSTTPVPSRVSSPALPYSSGASSCSSDSEDEPGSPLLGPARTRRPRRDQYHSRRWFSVSSRPTRRRHDTVGGIRALKRGVRLVVRHPFFPKTPVTILLTLLFLSIFGVSLTFLLMYILNPDKEPLPWRGYCTIPRFTTAPPQLSLPTTAQFPDLLPANFSPPTFPPPGVDFDSLSPAGVLVGVFSMDASVERRMLIRSTWASHPRSREGAVGGDGGVGTSRTVVRFIMGQPRKEWERRIKLEQELYNDLVVLPIAENMNDGKTHAYFAWAAQHAWVPPLYFDNFTNVPRLSYANATSPAPAPADHDSRFAKLDYIGGEPLPWVRPDFVAKVDDDAFVMLAELEARLRVELHQQAQTNPGASPVSSSESSSSTVLSTSSLLSEPSSSQLSTSMESRADTPARSDDPLIFWGYLVKNRFMAGELYVLSFALVDWVAHDPQVRTMTRGAEDKQTSKWIRAHPRAQDVRWVSERCWIYDHPRASTVYSHGFLFPSEVERVQKAVLADLARVEQHALSTESASFPSPFGPTAPWPHAWAQSTVSKFGARYAAPVADLDLEYSVEALVEGSAMSQLHEGSAMTPELAWEAREGRNARYAGRRVGGTVVVHFIKKNMWFLEAATAFLHGADVTPAEKALEGAVDGWTPSAEDLHDPARLEEAEGRTRLVRRHRQQ